MKPWLLILILSVCGVLLLVGITMTIILFISMKDKKDKNAKVQQFYVEIMDIMGGIENIVDVSVNSSRLSLVLKDPSIINNDNLEKLKDKGIGIVKSSKKITLVVGEMASDYYNSIKKELEK